MKKYEILGGNLPVVVCELSAGESMITESGSMSWMSPNMKMETISGGGMKKMFGRLMSGDSAFQNRYTAEGADGMIAFASSFPGAIKALEISNGHSMIVQKSAFLASEEGVELSMHFQKKLGKGIFGGEGFIMQRLSGNGTAFVEIDEPTGNLDTATSHDVIGLLKMLSRQYQQTLIVITHDTDIAQMADRIVQIEDGKISKGSGFHVSE